MMVLAKPQLYAKFEVASFSRCIDIKGQPPNLGKLPQLTARLTFTQGVIF